MAIGEDYGLIWVCVDCMLHHANGECGDCHADDGHDCEPLSSIGDGFTVAMGMLAEEHGCREECPGHYDTDETLTSGAGIGEPTFCDGSCQPVPDECDCETNTYSTSQCEGCGSWLHGERHAFHLWKERQPRWIVRAPYYHHSTDALLGYRVVGEYDSRENLPEWTQDPDLIWEDTQPPAPPAPRVSLEKCPPF